MSKPICNSQVSLKVTSLDDLKRDVLKSDSAAVCIPELELEVVAIYISIHTYIHTYIDTYIDSIL